MKTIMKITSYKNTLNVNCTADHRESFQEPNTVPYTTFGNFLEGFIFAFFASQEPLMKLELQNFQYPCAPVSKSHFDPALIETI